MSYYTIRVSKASMPGNCWGRYYWTAVMEMEDGAPEPKAIDSRRKGVIRVVQTWGPSNMGLGIRSRAQKDEIEAQDLIDRLNERRAQEHHEEVMSFHCAT